MQESKRVTLRLPWPSFHHAYSSRQLRCAAGPTLCTFTVHSTPRPGSQRFGARHPMSSQSWLCCPGARTSAPAPPAGLGSRSGRAGRRGASRRLRGKGEGGSLAERRRSIVAGMAPAASQGSGPGPLCSLAPGTLVSHTNSFTYALPDPCRWCPTAHMMLFVRDTSVLCKPAVVPRHAPMDAVARRAATLRLGVVQRGPLLPPFLLRKFPSPSPCLDPPSYSQAPLGRRTKLPPLLTTTLTCSTKKNAGFAARERKRSGELQDMHAKGHNMSARATLIPLLTERAMPAASRDQADTLA